MTTDAPQTLKQIEQMRAYVAKQIAVIATATDTNTEGRHMEVLGVFGGGELKDLKRIGIPAMDALTTCTRVLSTFFIVKFKKYWRLHIRFDREGNERKMRRLERKLIAFETAYSLFQSAHDKALLYVDSIYNQFATRESILGAEKPEEEETPGLSWVASSLGRVDARRKSQKIAKSEHPSLDRKRIFRYPTFDEALEIARAEVEKQKELPVPEPQATPKRGKIQRKPKAQKAADRPKEVLLPHAGNHDEAPDPETGS